MMTTLINFEQTNIIAIIREGEDKPDPIKIEQEKL